MKIEALELSHHAELTEAFRKLQRPYSDYSFINSYLFRQKYRFEVWRGKNLYIKGQRPEGPSFLLCLDRYKNMDLHELVSLMKEVEFLYAVPRTHLEIFDRHDFAVGFWSGDSDYLFSKEKLAKYPGRKLDGPRNLSKQFQRDHIATRHKLTRSHLDDAKALLSLWHDHLKDPSDSDYANCLEALDLLDALPEMESFIWYVRGRPVGFIMGEQLTPKTFVVHFMKADKDYKGVYQYLYQSLAGALSPSIRCINLEQDLGKPSLRHAKSTYQPDSKCHKWRAILIDKEKDTSQIAGRIRLALRQEAEAVAACC